MAAPRRANYRATWALCASCRCSTTAGKRDSRDEAPEAAARRELREETGITARELIPLGPFYPAAAYSDEVIWMYLARGLTFGEQQLDDDEFLNLQAVPLVLFGYVQCRWNRPFFSYGAQT